MDIRGERALVLGREEELYFDVFIFMNEEVVLIYHALYITVKRFYNYSSCCLWVLQLVSEQHVPWLLTEIMADGTRLRGLDERLGLQDNKVNEVIVEVTRGRDEAVNRSRELQGRMEGMKIRMGDMNN